MTRKPALSICTSQILTKNHRRRHIPQLRQRSLSIPQSSATGPHKRTHTHQEREGSGSTYIDQLLRRRTGDVAVADAVGQHRDVVAELRARAGGVGDADVRLRRSPHGQPGKRKLSKRKGKGRRTIYPTPLERQLGSKGSGYVDEGKRLPASTIFFLPRASRCAARSVPVKELGCCLRTTFSAAPGPGVSSANSSASSVLGVKRGAPSGVLCRTCTWGVVRDALLAG